MSIAIGLRQESEFCTSQGTKYRADLDGLRAVAVLSVVGYHYFGPLFPGGFIGVDVFFVISGYLLSGIIISETEEGRFSFARFYERRIRRIFPALFVLLAICTIYSGMFLVTPDLQSYFRSMLAAAWSASNFYFWKTSNYFDSPAADKPLLHTWSLAVEEQFYLLFPIFIFLVYRYMKRRHLKAAILTAAIVSFIVSVITVRSDQAAAFYLPLGRAWELLLGAVIFLRFFPSLRERILNEVVAFCGIAFIGFSVFRFNLNTRFPGEHALIPCLGAAAIIYAGQSNLTLVHRLLSLPPLVFVGLISYSLYLWHWPLLVFSRISILPGLNPSVIGGRLVLVVIAVLLSTLSWRFVETPFRAGKHRPGRRAVYLFGATCVATVTVSVLMGNSWAPALRTFSGSADDIGSYIAYSSKHSAEFDALFDHSCFLDRGQPVSSFQELRCLSRQKGQPAALLFGDSEAANLRYGLQQSFPGVQILQATSSACPPLVRTVVPTTSECRDFVHDVMVRFIPKYKIGTVLLSAGWARADRQNLAATIEQLQQSGIRVVVFGPLPEYGAALPRLLAQSVSDGKTDFAHENRKTGLDDMDRAFSLAAEQEWHVPYISISELLCPNQVCVEFAGDKLPIQFDHVHLTLTGSVLVGQRIAAKYPDLFQTEAEVRPSRLELVP